MENSVIDTIEINGKTVEVPRSQKLFESYLAYWSYLEDLAREMFPADSKGDITISVKNEDDYEDFIDLCVLKLMRAADEKKYENKKSKRKGLFSKREKSAKKEKKSLLSILASPFKAAGKFIRKGIDKVKSILPWSKKKIDLDEALEQDENSLIENIDLDQALIEDENLIKEAVDLDDSLETDEKLQEEIINEESEEKSKEAEKIEELLQELEVLRKENRRLNRKLDKETRKVQEVEETFEEKVDRVVNTVKNDKSFKYGSIKVYNDEPLMDKVSIELPYEIQTLEDGTQELTIDNAVAYRRSLVLSETKDTVTISEEELNNLLEFERTNLEAFRYLRKKYLDEKNYKINVEASKGFVSKNIKTDFEGNIIDESFTITKDRYEELMDAVVNYLSFMKVTEYDYSEDKEEKILSKRA